MKRDRRVKNTSKLRRESTTSERLELADDHFQKLARERLDASFRELGIAPKHVYTITVPFEMRADALIRRALYRRRRGRAPEPETAGIIRAEVQRLSAQPAVSQRKVSERFWMHLTAGERYERYRVVVKDHKKTIEACLELL
ncbi:MAG TPA: hypothetical protein VKP61_15335 [Candidatus Acidoferrum sp.]|nr:hypothetical protein [Candidatus Acidoferrum sp.]